MDIKEEDLEIRVIKGPSADIWTNGWDKGVYIRHLPTDTYAFVKTGKTQMENKAKALRGLEAILNG